MTTFFVALWWVNIELSLLVAVLLLFRWGLRRFALIYNTYYLWLALPLTPLLSYFISNSNVVQKWISLLKFSLSDTAKQPAMPTDLASTQSLLAPTPQLTSSFSSSNLLLIFWSIGALFLLCRLIKQHLDLRKKLKSNHYQNELELNTRYPVIGVRDTHFSPAVYGFFKPTIYFPSALLDQLSRAQCELILRHEENHIRHGHLWLNLVWDLLICVFWFNPLIYFARRLFRHDQELFCDSLVLKNTDAPGHTAYGHALLSTVSATHSVSPLCSWKMFNQLEERIMNIKSQHLINKRKLLGAALIAVIGMGSLYSAATAHESKPIENKKVDDNIIRILNLDIDDNKQIIIQSDGNTYHSEQGESFIIENGERRELSQEEQETFTKLIEKSKQYALADGESKRNIFAAEKVQSFTFNHDEPLDDEELKARLEGLLPNHIDPKEIEVFKLLDSKERIDNNIERELEESKASKKVAVEKTRKKLQLAQQELAKSQEQLKLQRKILREQAEALIKLNREAK